MNGNYLFRGGSPDTGKESATVLNISDLRASLAQAAHEENVTLPANYLLLDISLENLKTSFHFVPGRDGYHVQAEYEYSADNPHLGDFIFWEMHGTSEAATHPALEKSRPWFAATFDSWNNDRLVERVERMRWFLANGRTSADSSERPLVIFAHCDCGCDRTGELFGAYAMRFFSWTWSRVNEENTRIAGRPMMCHNYRMMQWYCLYLEDNGYSIGQCLQSHKCTELL